jgi:hypothetical protein
MPGNLNMSQLFNNTGGILQPVNSPRPVSAPTSPTPSLAPNPESNYKACMMTDPMCGINVGFGLNITRLK